MQQHVKLVMETNTPFSLKKQALDASINHILTNPQVLYNIPNPVRVELAEKCHATLSELGKDIEHLCKRKSTTDKKLIAFLNSSVYKPIPAKYKTIRKYVSNSQNRRSCSSLYLEQVVLDRLKAIAENK